MRLALGVFFLLTAYYVLKTVREPLILAGGTFGLAGAEWKTYATAGQAVLLLAVVPMYGRLASRTNRTWLVNHTIVVLVVCLTIFGWLATIGVPIGLAYYLWLGIASVVCVAQFWSFTSDLYSHEDGERLFPAIAAGGTLGAIVGARLAHWMVGRWNIPQVLAVGGILLVCYLVVFHAFEAREHRAGRAAPHAKAPIGRAGGIRLTCRQRYLLLMGLMVACGSAVNAQGEYMMARAVSAYADEKVSVERARAGLSEHAHADIKTARQAVIGRVYANYYSTANALAFLLQSLVVSRILKRIGVRGALFIMPMLALVSYGGVALVPVFALVRLTKVTENGAEYSLQNTVRNALFLPTSREAKYKAKVVIDGFFFRAGDVIAAVVVLAGVHLMRASMRGFALLNVALVVIWGGLGAAVAVRHRRLTAATVRASGPEPTSPS